MLVLTHASLATVEELFRYKSQGCEMKGPGDTWDQWGIKAHNRPWIEEWGGFTATQKVIEVGGGYSSLPQSLADRYGPEVWVGDDFGAQEGRSELWRRWGEPRELQNKHPSVRYVFEPFGAFSSSFPDGYFDRIFTVSTLEHIPPPKRLAVIKDMNRCLAEGGRQLHTIDISSSNLRRLLVKSITDRFPILNMLGNSVRSDMRGWIKLFKASGVRIKAPIPNPLELLRAQTLVESPDVVYRFYPPNNAPKRYNPSASLLLIIEDM